MAVSKQVCVHTEHERCSWIAEQPILFVLGEPIKLSLAAEEIATFYAKMLDHEYTTKEAFQKNFFSDWKEVSHAILFPNLRSTC